MSISQKQSEFLPKSVHHLFQITNSPLLSMSNNLSTQYLLNTNKILNKNQKEIDENQYKLDVEEEEKEEEEPEQEETNRNLTSTPLSLFDNPVQQNTTRSHLSTINKTNFSNSNFINFDSYNQSTNELVKLNEIYSNEFSSSNNPSECRPSIYDLSNTSNSLSNLENEFNLSLDSLTRRNKSDVKVCFYK